MGTKHSTICLLVLALSIPMKLWARDPEVVNDQARDILELVSPSPGGKSIDQTEAAGICCTHANPQRPPPGCDVKAPRDSLRLVPQKWGLLATGADLMRDDPQIQRLEYRQSLGIVDSGLTLRGNPEAGRNLLRTSKENDDYVSGHGTHVTGIAASESFGVNPRLPIKMFGISETSRSRRSGLIERDALLNQLRASVEDPQVRVINLSISFHDYPEMVELVREGIERHGKWIVFAAGNEGSVSSRMTSGHDHFLSNPSFFKVGSSSYFAAPAVHSNFGSDVTMFAPGSRIRSLSFRNNPNLMNSMSSELADGTSMANPHFAATLATLANIAPQMDSRLVQELLQKTAINRGSRQAPVPFLNAYLAAQAALAARDCLQIKAESRCIQDAIAQVKRSASNPRMPAAGSQCADWRNYYTELRRAFFLTQGAPEVVEALQALLGMDPLPVAERFLFATGEQRGQLAELLQTVNISVYQSERDRASEFHRGLLRFGDEANGISDNAAPSGDRGASRRHPLSTVLPTPENMNHFKEFCLKPYPDTGTQDACIGYLREAPRRFRVAAVEEMLRAQPPITDTLLLRGADFSYDREYDEKVKNLYQQALRQCLGSQVCDTLHYDDLFRNRHITVSERRDLIKHVQKLVAEGKIQPQFLSNEEYLGYWKLVDVLLDPSKRPLEQNRVLAESLSSNRYIQRQFGPEFQIGNKELSQEMQDLRRVAIQARLGLNPPDLPASIERALRQASDRSDTNRFSMMPEVWNAVSQLVDSPRADDLGRFIARDNNLDTFHDAMGDSVRHAMTVSTLLNSEAVNPETKRLIIDAIRRRAQSSVPNSERDYRILQNAADQLLVRELLSELATPEGRKKYPGLDLPHVIASLESRQDTPVLRHLIEQGDNRLGQSWILGVDPDIILKNPPALRRFEDVLQTVANGQADEWQRGSVERLLREQIEPKLFERVAPVLIRSIPELTQGKTVNPETIVALAQRISNDMGRNEDLVRQTIETLRPFVNNENFRWRTHASNIQSEKEFQEFANLGLPPQVNGHNAVVQSFLILNESVAGQKLLQKSDIWPQLRNALQDRRFDPIIPKIDRLGVSEAVRIPEPLRDIYVERLREHLQTIKEVREIYPQKRFFEEGLYRNPELLQPLIEAARTFRQGSLPHNYVTSLISNYARKNPTERQRVYQIFKENDVTWRPSYFGVPGDPRSLRDELKELLDYE